MGDFLGKLFVEVTSLPDDGFGFIQVLFLGACYLYILLIGANMIGDGSELLMLFPSMAGVVGSVILPVLGAVPDGAIVLFSGLGPSDTAEQQVNVGVGALAGSTVMLITIPWFLSILGGRVPLGPVRDEGIVPLYGKQSGEEVAMGCTDSGVGPDSSIRKNAIVMLATCFPCYLIVEIPALIYMNEDAKTEAKDVGPFAWAGFVICTLGFIGYILYQYRLANAGSGDSQAAGPVFSPELEQRVQDIMIKSIKAGHMGLRGLLMDDLPAPSAGNGAPLMPDAEEAWNKKLQKIVKPFFNKFDIDGSGTLSRAEISNLMKTLGENPTPAEVEQLFKEADKDQSGEVDFKEFAAYITQLVQKERPPDRRALRARTASARVLTAVSVESAGLQASTESEGANGNDDDDDDDEPEVPEDILDLHLPPAQQRARVLRRSFWQMGMGTLIVLIFSDPMVDVLDDIGTRTKIPAFFVAFLLGPVASNASEMVASYKFAQKKSKKSITVALSQLLGAACMNNTFCLLIFYLLIAARSFTWTYHAEVIGIILSEVVMAVLASKRVHRLIDGVAALLVLPLCLVIVAVLKGTVFKKYEQ